MTLTQKREEELKTVNRALISQWQELEALKKETSEQLDGKMTECSALQATLQTVIAEKEVLESQCRDQEITIQAKEEMIQKLERDLQLQAVIIGEANEGKESIVHSL